MIPEWNYEKNDLDARKFCLGAIVAAHKYNVDRSVYEFCQSFVESGKAREIIERELPMEEAFGLIQDEYQMILDKRLNKKLY
tara:strand:- start:178 stop:423 length:246 start_codon:yes stop_codon:yes gene_type:complete